MSDVDFTVCRQHFSTTMVAGTLTGLASGVKLPQFRVVDQFEFYKSCGNLYPTIHFFILPNSVSPSAASARTIAMILMPAPGPGSPGVPCSPGSP